MSLEERPEPGSYVICRFPDKENPTEPGGKRRPGLIVGYGEEYGLGPNVAVIAYSTTQYNPQLRAIVNVRDVVQGVFVPLEETGGPYVDCINVRALPINRDYFPSGMEKIGYLPAGTFDHVKAMIRQYNPIPYTNALGEAAAVDSFYDDREFRDPYRPVADPDNNDNDNSGPSPR